MQVQFYFSKDAEEFCWGGLVFCDGLVFGGLGFCFFFGREKNKEGELGVFTYCILVLCNSYPKYSFFAFFSPKLSKLFVVNSINCKCIFLVTLSHKLLMFFQTIGYLLFQ